MLAVGLWVPISSWKILLLRKMTCSKITVRQSFEKLVELCVMVLMSKSTESLPMWCWTGRMCASSGDDISHWHIWVVMLTTQTSRSAKHITFFKKKLVCGEELSLWVCIHCTHHSASVEVKAGPFLLPYGVWWPSSSGLHQSTSAEWAILPV